MYSNGAFDAGIGPGAVFPGDGNDVRYGGFGVRCLLN